MKQKLSAPVWPLVLCVLVLAHPDYFNGSSLKAFAREGKNVAVEWKMAS